MYNNNYYPTQQITQVNGENGAKAYNLPLPNSSVLLLDTSAPLVWLVTTDGAGYKTCKAYNITPYEPKPQPDLNNIVERLEALEVKLNAKSNSKPVKQPITD